MKAAILILSLLLVVGAPAVERELTISVDGGTAVNAGTSFSAEEWVIGITPEPPTEQELINDDGSASYHWGGGIAGCAGLYTAPSDCWLVRVKYLCYNSGGRNYYIDVLGEDSVTSGKPDRNNSLIGGYQTFWVDGVSGDTWVEFELDEPLYLDSGDIFFPMNDDSIEGQDNEPQDGASSPPANSAWWYFDSGNWSDYTTFGAMMIRAIIDDDVTAPYTANADPGSGETGVPGDTNIEFDVADDDAGTDGSTIYVEVDDTDVTSSCTITDNGDGSWHVLYDPPSDFGGGDTVSVYWDGEDVLGNYGTDYWSFTIQDDWDVTETTWGALKGTFE